MWNTYRNGDWQVPSGNAASPWNDGGTQAARNKFPDEADAAITVNHNLTNVSSLTLNNAGSMLTVSANKTMAYAAGATWTFTSSSSGVIINSGSSAPPNLVVNGNVMVNVASAFPATCTVNVSNGTLRLNAVSQILDTLTFSGGTIENNGVGVTVNNFVPSGTFTIGASSGSGASSWTFGGAFPAGTSGAKTFGSGMNGLVVVFNGTADTTGWAFSYTGNPASTMTFNQDGILGSSMVAPAGGLTIAAGKTVAIPAGVTLSQHASAADNPITFGAGSALLNYGTITGGGPAHRWVLNGTATSALVNYGTLTLTVATINVPIFTMSAPTITLWSGMMSSFGTYGKVYPLRREIVALGVDCSRAYGFARSLS